MTQDVTLKLGRRIGEGRTAEIYAWGDTEVLKLYRPGWPTSSVEQEARISRQVAETRLPVPAVGGMIEVDGRPGILFERIVGPSLVQHFVTRPWTLLRVLHAFTELHLAMHAQVIPDLPSQRQQLMRQIQDASVVPTSARQAALTRLEQLPDGKALCHGDYHPENVLITRRGPIILDWAGATSGHPLADVARTALIVQMAALLPSQRAHWLLASVRRGGRKRLHPAVSEAEPGARGGSRGMAPAHPCRPAWRGDCRGARCPLEVVGNHTMMKQPRSRSACFLETQDRDASAGSATWRVHRGG